MVIAVCGIIGFIFHLGPDHYLPLVAWPRPMDGVPRLQSMSRFATFHLRNNFGGCPGHLLGLAYLNLEAVQSFRTDFAGWFLLSFGAIYLR